MNIYPLANEIKAIESAEEVDSQTIQDTIEAMPLEGALDGAQKWRKNIQGDIAAIDEEIKRLQKRKTSLKNKDNNIKDAMFYVLSKTGQKSIKTPLFTFSKRKGKEVVVLEEDDFKLRALVNMGFGTRKFNYILDKEQLKNALKEGEELPGATLETSQETLQVR